MGDPKKFRKKYTTPRHPWQRLRLEAEKVLVAEYALKNKKELWKMSSMLDNFTSQAKLLTPKLQSNKKDQALIEKKQLLDRLARLGLLSTDANLTDVLNLTTRDILERRLQTIVLKKDLARTMNQARQFITHGHITVNGTKITAPSYLVKASEDSEIAFSNGSSLVDEQHPERTTYVKAEEVVAKEEPVKEEKAEETKEAAKEDN